MKIKHYLLAMLLCALFQMAQATTDDPTDNAHFGYIENKGQIHDQNGNARADVRFMYFDDQFKLTLRNTGFSYEFTKSDYLQANNTESGTPKDIKDDDEVEYNWQYTVNRVDVDFVNSNQNVEVISEGQSPFYRNFFNQYTGYKGITRIHSFYKVTYENIYNGIDLVFTSEQQADGKIFPKYEFVIHPSGNLADIALNYKGDFQFNVVNEGDLKINTGLGYVQETQPIILFSDGRASEKGKFIRHGSMISFNGVKRSAGETITIDPTIDWGTYWGGNQKDLTDEITVDLNNNALITGRTRSTNAIATTGAYQTTNAGALDVPLLKWNPDGSLNYATYYGGESNEIGFCITVDPYNQIWIGGHTFSTTGIATPDALQKTFGGGEDEDFDVLLAKFTNDGDLMYGSYLGGVGQDEFQNIWADEDGNIYGSGLAEALDSIIYSPCYKCVGDTAGDIIIMKFDNYGNQLWANYWGGKNRDRGHGVTTFGDNVYQCGTVQSSTNIAYGNPGGSLFNSVYQGSLDIFIARWNKETGAPVWITYFGGVGGERGRDIRCDRYGDIYFVGQTESGFDGLATPGAWSESFDTVGTRQPIVVKLDSNCNKLFATYVGSKGITMPRSLRVNPEGAPIYVAGYTKCDSGFVTSDAFDKKNNKNNDAFWFRLNWNMSNLQYSTYFGGKKQESVTEAGWYGPSMEVDAFSNVYLSSGTNSTDGIAFGNSYKDTLYAADQYDFFLAKFNDPCPDGFEPNDQFSNATLLRFLHSNSITRYAPIQVKKDKDYFYFRTAGGNNNLKVTLTDLPFDCDIFVYDSLQNQLGKSVNSGLTNETVIVNSSYVGKYYVLVKSPTKEFGNACYTLTVNESSVPFRFSDESALGSISLYPNPADYSATLQFDCKLSGEYHVDVCDLQGRIIIPMKQQLETGEQNIMLALSSLSAGTYFVKVNGNGMQDVVKLIVQK